MNIKIQTKGMHCKSCGVLVKGGLDELPGIKNVKVSHETGIVEVEFDDKKVNQEKIIKTIISEGYEIK